MGERALTGIEGGCEETRTGKDKDEGGASGAEVQYQDSAAPLLRTDCGKLLIAARAV